MGAHRRAQPDSGRVTPAASRRRQGEDEALLQRDHAILAAWSLGCQPAVAPAARTADARHLPGALAAVEADPASAVERCAVLTTPAIRGDCIIHGVERLARTNPQGAEVLCASLDGLSADECWFQLAERSGEPERCDRAGRFAEDCRMHAWTARVPKLAGPTDPPEVWAEALSRAASEMGFSSGDERPWVAASRFRSGGSCRSTGRSVMGGR